MKSISQISAMIIPICFLLLLFSPPYANGQNLCQWDSGKCKNFGCPYGCNFDTEADCECPTAPKKFLKTFKNDAGN
ncbi:hypothetical protein niasHT_000849 [Heterodera trifolii]|uniref:Uncharacterized protein n=1 Tax=Heterodera trifolii TaxID=157864 RepID=A0ABD2LVA3_9BILA